MVHARVNAQNIAQSVRIPPRPEVLVNFRQELASGNPDFDRLVKMVASDVSLSGAILQIINSPAFGMRNRITSIAQACSLLGLPRVEKVVQAVALRGALSKGMSLERFWDSANEIANICRVLAMKLSGQSADDAYTLGLFHDCGIPLLMQHFPDYKQTLMETNQRNLMPATLLEDERYGVNHTQVGYEVANQWFLPDAIAGGILLHHHDITTLSEDDIQNDPAYSLICLLKMAEYLSANLRKAWRSNSNHEWNAIGHHVLAVMGIDPDDFTDLCAEVIDAVKAA